MTDSPEAAGKAVPNPTPTVLDAVAAHLRRTIKHLENDALLLAVALRDTDAALHAARAKNAELEAKLAALEADDGAA